MSEQIHLTHNASAGNPHPSPDLLPGLPDEVAKSCIARVGDPSDYASLACVNKLFNSLINSRHLYEMRKQMGIPELYCAYVYDGGGWEVFNPTYQKWTKVLPKIPYDIDGPDFCFESLVAGNDLLIFGRDTQGNIPIWKYSSHHRDWDRDLKHHQILNLLHPSRRLFGSGTFGSITIIAGGTDMNDIVSYWDILGTALKSAELFNHTTNRWECLPDMHTTRISPKGFFMDGKFYVIGGVSVDEDGDEHYQLTCGEEYNLHTGKWRIIHDMWPCGSGLWHTFSSPYVAVVDNQLYAVDYVYRRHQDDNVLMMIKYDKEKNCWDVLGRLPISSVDVISRCFALKSYGNQLLIVVGVADHNKLRSPGEDRSVMLFLWCPKSSSSSSSGIKNGDLELKFIGVKNFIKWNLFDCVVIPFIHL